MLQKTQGNELLYNHLTFWMKGVLEICHTFHFRDC